jgi:NDP-4-keto-2,6-dideoxyhexose 3-C-methyltransferase
LCFKKRTMSMRKVLDVGSFHVSDFPLAGAPTPPKYPLDLYLDESIGAVRLKEMAPAEDMWGKYWYRSGMNTSMTITLQALVDEVVLYVPHNVGDVWLDIACNDGTLLRSVPDDFVKVGIDPCDDSY